MFRGASHVGGLLKARSVAAFPSARRAHEEPRILHGVFVGRGWFSPSEGGVVGPAPRAASGDGFLGINLTRRDRAPSRDKQGAPLPNS